MSSIPQDEPHASDSGAGIRLPPISFLAQDHPAAAHFASLIQPIRLQSTKAPEQANAMRHVALEPSSTQADDTRSLPKPKALGLFPLLSAGGLPQAQLSTVPLQGSSLAYGQVKTEPTSLALTITQLSTSQPHSAQQHLPPTSQILSAQPATTATLASVQGLAVTLPSRSLEYAAVAIVKKRKGKPTLDKMPLEELIRSLYPQRRHLGAIVYNPTTTWSTLQFEQLHGLQEHDKQRLRDIRDGYIARKAAPFSAEEQKYIPVIPPLTEASINSFLEVKIPYRFIKAFVEDFTAGIVQQKRRLWGGAGGIYSDDSDILCVLCHLGLFDDTLDLTDCNPEWTSKDVVRPLVVQKDSEKIDLLDLSVTLLMYPGLNAYHGFYTNGLNSRSWINCAQHDGLSYGVYQVKWESCSMSTDERNLLKQSASELEEDRCYQEEVSLTKGGWIFDQKLYKRLRRENDIEKEKEREKKEGEVQKKGESKLL